MADVKLEMKKKRLEQYYTAEERILKGQSYTIGSRQLTRANLVDVQKKIKELEAEVEMLEKRGTTKRRSARIIPMG